MATRSKRKSRKKRARTAFNIFVLLAVVCGLILSLTVFFDIESIVIEGESDYTQQEILAAFGVEEGDNLFRFVKGSREKRIERLLPYIESVSISRTLPSTVTLNIVPAAKVACVLTQQGYAVIGRECKVLELSASRPQGMPLILGVETEKAEVGQALQTVQGTAGNSAFELAELLQTDGFTQKIDLIDVNNKLSVKLVYDSRILVTLGTASDMQRKLSMFKLLISEKLEEDFTGYIDLSVAGEGLTGVDPTAVSVEYPNFY